MWREKGRKIFYCYETNKNDTIFEVSTLGVPTLKPLLPSLKEKKRYIVFEVLAQTPVHESEVYASITDAVYHISGIRGLADAGMQFIPERWNASKQRGVVRVHHTATDTLKAAFPFIRSVARKKAIVRSIATSGILGKTEKLAR